jgi:hypothetical protein
MIKTKQKIKKGAKLHGLKLKTGKILGNLKVI